MRRNELLQNPGNDEVQHLFDGISSEKRSSVGDQGVEKSILVAEQGEIVEGTAFLEKVELTEEAFVDAGGRGFHFLSIGEPSRFSQPG